ncbi:HD domain-containing protein [Streptomyces sp. NBC_01381]|uniref:HD domain-containing protein n=1 Tax=Streptomyces sp. NBC_01381 TaxID=2903845 RepID=UPI002B1D976A|nr:HD domain-containing protein [Streptomyces sp. NBC_01381]
MRTHHAEADPALIEQAHDEAARWHEGQTRRSGDPYLTHCLAVAAILADLGMPPVVVCAALLHDIEDTPCPPDRVVEQFGQEIAQLIAAARTANANTIPPSGLLGGSAVDLVREEAVVVSVARTGAARRSAGFAAAGTMSGAGLRAQWAARRRAPRPGAWFSAASSSTRNGTVRGRAGRASRPVPVPATPWYAGAGACRAAGRPVAGRGRGFVAAQYFLDRLAVLAWQRRGSWIRRRAGVG